MNIVYKTKDGGIAVELNGVLTHFDKTDTPGVYKKGKVFDPIEEMFPQGEAGRGQRFDYAEDKGLLVEVPVYCRHMEILPQKYWSGEVDIKLKK